MVVLAPLEWWNRLVGVAQHATPSSKHILAVASAVIQIAQENDAKDIGKKDNTEIISVLRSRSVRLAGGIERSVAQCLRYGYWLEGEFADGWRANPSIKRPEGVRVAGNYGFVMKDADILLIATNHAPMIKLLERTRFRGVALRASLLSMEGVKYSMLENENPRRIRCGGMRKSCIEVPKELLESIGFYPPKIGDSDYRASNDEQTYGYNQTPE